VSKDAKHRVFTHATPSYLNSRLAISLGITGYWLLSRGEKMFSPRRSMLNIRRQMPGGFAS
jgi:hypothetical protein